MIINIKIYLFQNHKKRTGSDQRDPTGGGIDILRPSLLKKFRTVKTGKVAVFEQSLVMRPAKYNIHATAQNGQEDWNGSFYVYNLRYKLQWGPYKATRFFVCVAL